MWELLKKIIVNSVTHSAGRKMSAVVVSLAILGLLCALFRMLHLSIYAGEPKLFYKEGSQFVKSVLDLCPIFKEV